MIKYDLFSIITAVVVLTTLTIGALVLANFIGGFGNDIKSDADDMVTDGSINQTNADYSTDFIVNDSAGYADNYVFWFFIATFAGLILTALYLDFEPSIMIIIFIFGSIACLGAWMGSGIHSEFAEDSDLNATSTQMPKTNILIGTPYFPIFIFIGLVIMLVIMYSKKRAGEYQ